MTSEWLTSPLLQSAHLSSHLFCIHCSLDLRSFLRVTGGVSVPVCTAMVRSARTHLHKWFRLRKLDAEASREIDTVNALIVRNQRAHKPTSSERQFQRCEDLENRLLLRRISSVVKRQQVRKAASRYPMYSEDFMPTRLGNMLRRHERLAGAPFGLDSIVTMPYLAQIAGEEERAYLDDKRTGLDLSVRMVLVWTISAVTTTSLLWRDRAWLLIPLLCLVLAYLTYLGCVANAAQYGTALIVVMALSRERLYNSLGLSLPSTSDEEIARNMNVRDVLAGYPSSLEYQWASTGGANLSSKRVTPACSEATLAASVRSLRPSPCGAHRLVELLAPGR